MVSYTLIKFILLSLLLVEVFSAPTSETKLEKRSISTDYNNPNMIPINMKNYSNYRSIKKDMFMSRGWGAGGMPFSVLYMGPTSSKAPMEQFHKVPMPMKSKEKQQERPNMKVAQLRNPIMGNIRRKMKGNPIIPQLFVSYGWGPAGK